MEAILDDDGACYAKETVIWVLSKEWSHKFQENNYDF